MKFKCLLVPGLFFKTTVCASFALSFSGATQHTQKRKQEQRRVKGEEPKYVSADSVCACMRACINERNHTNYYNGCIVW